MSTNTEIVRAGYEARSVQCFRLGPEVVHGDHLALAIVMTAGVTRSSGICRSGQRAWSRPRAGTLAGAGQAIPAYQQPKRSPKRASAGIITAR
jgi:hypothetical protein